LSFVLGLLFFVPLVGFGAVLFGVIALGGVEGSRGALRGRGFAIAGIALGVFSILFVCFTIPATLALLIYARASALSDAEACRANLDQIGVAVKIYKARTGAVPADLQAMVDSGLVTSTVECCPADRRYQPGSSRYAGILVDYCYAAVRDASGPPQPVPIAWDRFLFHGAKSVNVLFANGETKFVTVADLERLVKANAFRYGKPPRLPQPLSALPIEPGIPEPSAPAQTRSKPAPPALWDLLFESSSAARSIDTTASALRLTARVDSTSAVPNPAD
jgi:hypothetical protein